MFTGRVASLGAWHCALGRLWLAARPPATERLFGCRTRRKMTSTQGRKSGPNKKRRERSNRRPPTERKWPHGRKILTKTLTFLRNRPMRTTPTTPGRRKASAPSGDRPVARAFLPPRTVCTGRLVKKITFYRSSCVSFIVYASTRVRFSGRPRGHALPGKNLRVGPYIPGGVAAFFYTSTRGDGDQSTRKTSRVGLYTPGGFWPFSTRRRVNFFTRQRVKWGKVYPWTCTEWPGESYASARAFK